MKRKLLILLCALLTSVGMWAQGTWTAPEVPGVDPATLGADDVIYIYNVEADAFANFGMNYDTEGIATKLETGDQAASDRHKCYVKSHNEGVIKIASEKSTSKFFSAHGDEAANNIFVDQTDHAEWTLASTGTNIYSLTNKDRSKKLDVSWKYGGKLTIVGGQGFYDWAFIPVDKITDGSYAKYKEKKAMYAVYKSLESSGHISDCASALATANTTYVNSSATVDELRSATRILINAVAAYIKEPCNVSALFTNADIRGNWNNTGWGVSGGLDWGGVMEKFHTTFTLKQTQSVPNGVYNIVFHGMYREDGEGNAPVLSVTGSGDAKTANVPTMVSFGTAWACNTTKNGWATNSETNIPNDRRTTGQGLTYGDAVARVNDLVVDNESMTIEVKCDGTDQWVTLQGFDISYRSFVIADVATEFTSGSETAVGQWYKVTISSKGFYGISSSNAATLSYTQDGTKLKENDDYATLEITADGTENIFLNAGTFYFKSEETTDITITDLGNGVQYYAPTPTDFSEATSATSGQWYNVTTTKGYYDITASGAVTISYTQDAAQDADNGTFTSLVFSSAETKRVFLSASTPLYFKTNDTKNITITSLGNDVQYYAPEVTDFSSGASATASTWYAVTISADGIYKVSSTGDVTLSYTQDETKDADDDNFTSLTVKGGSHKALRLSEGKLYFKSSANSTLTITALNNNTNVTDLFITNPSFETGDKTGWTDAKSSFSIVNDDNLSGKDGTYYAHAFLNTTRSLTQNTGALEAGKYILSVYARLGKYNGNIGSAMIGLGGNTTPIQGGVDATTYYVAYEAEANATPMIEFHRTGTHTYHYFDNFTLTYYETLPDVSISDLTSQAMAPDVRADLTSASTTYSGSKTVANYNALQTAIINAKVSIADFAGRTGDDADWTDIITNPSFETGTPNYYKGWTVEVSSGSSTSDDQHRYKADGMGGEGEGSWRFFIWTENAGAATVKQTVSELPSGNYKLSAYMASGAGDVFTLSAGSTNSKVIASDGNATLVEVYFNQASKGNIEISATHSDSWFDLDNFHLTSNPTLPESITGVSGNMNSTVASAQTTAVNAYNAESGQTFANMLAAQTAINSAVDSKKMYKSIAAIRDKYQAKADDLDEAGQAAYTAAINVANTGALTQYTEGAYASISDAETAFHNDYVKAVKAQTTENTDMTEAITNPSFDTKNANGWKITETSHGNQQYGSLTAESWNNNSVKYSQDITGLHSGVYMLTAQVDNGRNNNNVSLFAKIGETTESTLAPYRGISSYASTSSDLIADVSLCYTSVIFNVASDNTTATIGVNDVSTSEGWMIFDNFHLIYVGESLPASIESLTGIMNKDVKDAANAAIETYNSENTIANYEAAQAAITRAEVSEAEYAKVSNSDRSAYRNRMGELLTKTNVYTTAAYNKWYANVEDNYTNGVYTDAEVVTLTAAGACQGAAETAHKKANRIDDVLLSSWTIGGEQCSDYNKNLYINTWSVEGNSDGSGFQTPFFEYWTSDGNSLGEATMVGTVTGLEASTEYSVDIWARVRQTNNQEKVAEKIMLQVGSGAAVDIAAGTQHTTHGTSDFYNGHFTAVGYTDGSGDLTITISVAAESNVSWLSFKDVAYNRHVTDGDEQTYSGIINNDTEIEPTTTAPIVDITAATFNGELSADFGSNENGFIIATAEQKAALGETKNVVVGNTCDNLVITDGTAVTIPADLETATSATYSRNIAPTSNFGTICLPYDVESDDDIQYYTVTSISDGVLNLETVDKVSAGTPAIFKKKNAEATSITAASSDASVTDAASEEGSAVVLVGTFEEIRVDGIDTPDAEDCYYISNNQFWQGNEYFFIGAFRAYLTGGAGARLTIQVDDEETAINTLEELNDKKELKDGKYLINGRIVVVKDGNSFSIDGVLE